MVDTLNRYILRQLLLITVFVTIALTLAIWLTQSLRLIRLIVNHGLSFSTFLELTVLLLPMFLLIILPIALFLAVLYTYNRLLMDRELIVMRSTGMSNLALAKPALFMSAMLSAIVMVLSFYLVPAAFRQFSDAQNAIRSNFAAVAIQEGRFNSFGEQFMVYVRERSKDGDLTDILVQDNRNPAKPVTMMARRGAFINAEGGPRVVLFNGRRQEYTRKTGRINELSFDRYSFELGEIYKNTPNRWLQPSERSISQLLNPDPTSQNDRAYRKKLIAEGHNRIVTPAFPIALTLIALVCLLFGEFNRRGQMKRIILAIGGCGGMQGAAIGLNNAAAKIPELIPLMYINVLFPIAVGLYVLLYEKRARAVTVSAEPTRARV
jgi:lipopolysaccharide export system permease protein